MSEPIISDRRAVYRTLGPGERIIDGRVYYSAAWLDPAPDSREDFDRFFQERLGAAIQQTAQEHGREVTPPEETQYELHNLIKS